MSLDLKLELNPSAKDEAYVQELLDSEWLSDRSDFCRAEYLSFQAMAD